VGSRPQSGGIFPKKSPCLDVVRGLALTMLAAVVSAPAQTGGGGVSLTGKLIDPSDAPTPGVLVRLGASGFRAERLTGEAGDFRFDGLPPGDYLLEALAPGFDPVAQRVRIGSRSPQPLLIRLKLAALREELSVFGDDRSIAAAPASNADTLSVERPMLDRLPFLDLDYVGALSRFLDPGAPGEAEPSKVVDGMEMRNTGVTASAIQEIRINNNPYTAEFPRWSRRRIEVTTKTSADGFHGTLNFLLRDYRLNARDAFARERPREQRRLAEGSLFGPVGGGRKTSFLFSGMRQEDDLVAIVFARDLRGPVYENVPAPQVVSLASLRISHAFSDQQAVFWQYNFHDRWQNNSGVGGITLAEAGLHSRFREDEFTFHHRAVLSPRALSQFRVLVGRYWAPARSNLDAPRVVVTDAWAGGGAQMDRLATEAHRSLTWIMTHTAGKRTFKYGVNIPAWTRRGLSDRTFRRGAFSYASLDDLAAGRPFAVVLQRGEPRTVFVEKNAGGFVQQEWQVRPNFSLAAGLRYDWQNYFRDHDNFGPRLALAWAPSKNRRTVIRAGAGSFFERSGPSVLADIARFDGVRLHRYVLTGPLIPPDGNLDGPLGAPSSIHRLDRGAELPSLFQFNFGVERQLASKTTLAVNYVGVRGSHQFRSRDANAPLPPEFAARPDPGVNVLRHIESAGRLASNALEVTLRGALARRVTGLAQYVYGKTMTDTGGLYWYPANSFAPEGEWGRADTDRRHQLQFLGTLALHRWANFGLSLSLLSGIPFNVTTGRDENRDGQPMDRPPGVTRNSGRGPGLASVDLRWHRDWRLSPSRKDKSPLLTCAVDAFNVGNRVNYQNYIGALTSPFFGRAVGSHPARRLQAGLRLQF
jgi:hypothetical protein